MDQQQALLQQQYQQQQQAQMLQQQQQQQQQQQAVQVQAVQLAMPQPMQMTQLPGMTGPGAGVGFQAAPGRSVAESKHSTDVESPPAHPRVCMSVHTEGESCSDLGSNACSQ
jgi:hypothetical protein